LRVDQFLPTFVPFDAIGQHVLRLKGVLEKLGPSHIYADRIDAALRGEASHYLTYPSDSPGIVIYHSAIGSPVARFLLSTDAPVIVDYHNVTPMHYFVPYEPHDAALMFAGRSQCQRFASNALLAVGHSEYSRRELVEMGFARTEALPILLDFGRYEEEPNRRLLSRLERSKRGTDILFVGRVSPQKRHEDLIKTFAVYKRHFDRNARLFMVGPASSFLYWQTLDAFIKRVGVQEAYLVGPVSFRRLLAYYRNADVFLSMSKHEGFCVPLVEAMKFEVPILALGAAAVPETLGDAGIVFYEKRFEEVAALLHIVVTDTGVRQHLIDRGRKRLEELKPERHEARWLDLLSSVPPGSS
jgi:glycosyltransferase involved in cell wall biosynthesis